MDPGSHSTTDSPKENKECQMERDREEEGLGIRPSPPVEDLNKVKTRSPGMVNEEEEGQLIVETQSTEYVPRNPVEERKVEPAVVALPEEVKCEIVKRVHGDLDKIITVPSMSLVEKPKRKYK